MKLHSTTLVVFCAVLALPLHLHSVENRSFAITAVVEKPDGMTIRFSMKNISKDPIRIFTALLPWKNSSSTIYILRKAPDNLRESNKVSFGFPPTGDTIVKSGEEISGEVRMKNLFTMDQLEKGEKGAFLYWSYVYDPDDSSSAKKELYGGVLLLN